MRNSTLSLLVISIFLISGCNVLQNVFSKKDRMVRISTNHGDMTVLLYDVTPQHRDNFIKLTKEGFYDSLLFHRVIDQFMIQGGAPESKYAGRGGRMDSNIYYLPNEFQPEIIHKRGVIAAARDNNPEKASSGSQFYIVQGKKFLEEDLKVLENKYPGEIPAEHRSIYEKTGGTPHLYLLEYTAFGEVVEGLEVIDKIAALPTDGNDRPLEDVVIISVEIVR